MLISTQIEKNDDTQAIVIVRAQYFAGPSGIYTHELDTTFLVTLDKITSRVAVQCEGTTRMTRVQFDPTDRFDIEEKAAMCALHFPRGGA